MPPLGPPFPLWSLGFFFPIIPKLRRFFIIPCSVLPFLRALLPSIALFLGVETRASAQIQSQAYSYTLGLPAEVPRGPCRAGVRRCPQPKSFQQAAGWEVGLTAKREVQRRGVVRKPCVLPTIDEGALIVL